MEEVGENGRIIIREGENMSQRTIEDVIAGRQLVTASKDMAVRAACRLMTETKVSALLVMNGKKLEGIFTERDALVKILVDGRDPEKTKLSEVMVANPQTVRAAQPMAYALLVMVEGGFRHVPVVDDAGAVVGMISARDAMGADFVRLERELDRRETLENPRS